MFALGPIGFSTPWILAALVALPVLWLLLRAVPPAPVKRLFPGVVLLLGLDDRDAEADRTPWWLMLLRMLAVGAMILGFAGPVLNPDTAAEPSTGLPLLILVENGWAAAPDWSARMQKVETALEEAARQGRLAALVLSQHPQPPQFKAAQQVLTRVAGAQPTGWGTTVRDTNWLADVPNVETLWIVDGLAQDGRAALLSALEALGPVTIAQPPTARLALKPVIVAEGLMEVTALRSQSGTAQAITVLANGPDPAGNAGELARLTLDFTANATQATARLSLPPELRNRITRFAIEGENAAGAIILSDDSLQRRRIGLAGAGAGREGLELLAPLHYLEKALAPNVELVAGSLQELTRIGADVIVLADVASLPEPDQRVLAKWVADGGLLLRFAGPHLAAADVGRGVEDVLLPVRLRAGGRVVGGAMSWGQPRAIAPFEATSPFYGLTIPDEVTVSAQVLAEPGPELGARTIAALADGTPLVTRKTLGDGQIVLFHVTANAEWSGLPLSGLFIEMLRRLAVSATPGKPSAEALAGTTWMAAEIMDGYGVLSPAKVQNQVAGEALTAIASADLPAGIYAHEARRVAVNAVGADTVLAPSEWPAHVTPVWGAQAAPRDVSGWLWLVALAALGLDIIAALALSGRLPHLRRGNAVLVLAVLVLGGQVQNLRAQEADIAALSAAAADVTLGYVRTGDTAVDTVSQAGLLGLSDELFRRTSIAPAMPVGVDLEADELSVFPLLYWPITETQTLPSAAAYQRLGAYLASGGMVLFDTRDAHISGFGGAATPAARRLQALAAPLDIPLLEPVPEDHVLTRTFYLLSSFPGRHARGALWVEAALADAKQAEGMPFRNLNDGVSPVIIGGNDWASAWAVRSDGAKMFPVGRGREGEQQREMAYRFGINLVMHVLTGNYKSDQVHVPALLERLGQ